MFLLIDSNNKLLYNQGEVVRLKLKPELTGVISGFYYNNKYLGNSFNTGEYSSSTCDAVIVFLNDDLSTTTKRYPVIMIEKV